MVFNSDTFEEVYCSHVLEHVDDLPKTMQEIQRICKPGARIKIMAPHFSSGVSWRDPTHKRLFSYFTFDYFTDDCPYAPVKYKIISRKLNFTRQTLTGLNPFMNVLLNISPALYERFLCWMIPCAEVIVELEVIK